MAPIKYTAEFIAKQAIQLIKYAEDTDIPLKQGFAAQQKYPSENLSRWALKNEGLYQALKRFEDIQQEKIILAAMTNKINNTMAIFTLKNVAGWRDVQEQKDQKHGLTVQVINFDRKESADSRIEVRRFDTSASV